MSQKVFDGCKQINSLKSGYANKKLFLGNFPKKNISFFLLQATKIKKLISTYFFKDSHFNY